MASAGEPLPGGTANRGRVVRVGDVVHRPAGRHTPAVHALLRHLSAAGFAGSPRVLGRTTRTEQLRYIEGEAAVAPLPTSALPPWATADDALVSVGALLRDYHRCAAGFRPDGWHWQRPVPVRWRGELVTHNDVHPANVVFRDARAVALIDFDLAAPARAAWDLAVTACTWVPLRAAADVEDDRRDGRLHRFRLLLDAYGAPARLRREVVDALPDANAWIAAVIEDAARQGHPAFERLWLQQHGVHIRAAEWLAGRAGELARAGQDG